jgi:uncharacterized protein (TIGR02452 family)
MTAIRLLPCLDDAERADARKQELFISHERSFTLAQETLEIVKAGGYRTSFGRNVSIADAVRSACRSRVSIPPEAALPATPSTRFEEMRIQVANETTTGAARRLGEYRTMVLNFANGLVPGGGFVVGARAQEESLCRASALFETLRGDAMYEVHAHADDLASSDYAILSPNVPFFRDETWALVDEPHLLSVLTCAAPVAGQVGRERAARLLRGRIHRVLAIMAAYRYEGVVLGAWGCGAFGNDPRTTAADFRDALLGPYCGAFREVVFAVTDWSPERRSLGPFRDAFAGQE